MKKTTLHAQHEKLGARMGEFGGWDMPIQYAGILQEHHHTRTNASVFDICHMGEFELAGPTAWSDLDRLLTCRLDNLAIGQVRYGFMLNDEGGVIDDLTCYRMDEDRFMLVVNAGTAEADARWIQAHLSDATVFDDISERTAKLDFQGPKSRDVLEDVLGCALPDLGYFRFKEFELMDASVVLSRTGYTGEWGYEIYLPNDAASALWDRVLSHELAEPGGLGARDTLRLEMGYPLYGHELSQDSTPAAVSRGMFIQRDKDFIGKAAVQRDLNDPDVLLIGLIFDSRRAAREGDRVFLENDEVGVITSGSMAPSLGVAVAMALVKADASEIGRSLEVDIRGRRHSAEVVELPFYRQGTARG